MSKIYRTTLLILLGTGAFSQAFIGASVPGQAQRDDHDDGGPIRVGYAIVTPGTTKSTVAVFETFALKRGGETAQVGILPSDMTTNAIVFVSTHGRLSRNLGLAIVNPSGTAANVTLALQGENGSVLATKTIPVTAGAHTARFVTELFADRSSVPRDLIGTLRITSTNAIAITGLRFRGLNFSTISITNLSGPTPVPVVKPGVGGPGAALLGHFVAGGGWASEVVIANPGSAPVPVRLDLFKPDGSPLTARLNGTENVTFSGTVPANGVLVFSPRDANGDSRF